MFVHEGKLEFWWRGVFNSALYHLSESHSFEVNPQLSSYSALLAGFSTEPLNLSKSSKNELTTLRNAKTYPTKGTWASIMTCFAMFFMFLILFNFRQSTFEDWQVEMCLSTSMKNYVLLRTEKTLVWLTLSHYSSAWAKWAGSVSNKPQPDICRRTLQLCPPSQQYRETSTKQHKSWKLSKRWQRDSPEEGKLSQELYAIQGHIHTQAHQRTLKWTLSSKENTNTSILNHVLL